MARMSMAEKMAKSVKPLDETPVAEPAGEQPAQLHLVESPAPAVDPAAKEDVADSAADAADTAEVAAAPAAAPGRSAPRAKKTRPKTTTRSGETAEAAGEPASYALQVELDPELDKRLVAYRQQTRVAFHHIILDAVESTHTDLPGLVAKALGRDETPTSTGSLFQRSTAAAPVRAGEKQERELHTIRTTLTNRNVLDQVATDVGAPSRNFMISVALDAYLPGGEGR